MKTTFWLLLFAIFLLRGTSQRSDKGNGTAEDKIVVTEKKNVELRSQSKEYKLAQLQKLLKQTTNSTASGSSQVTATRQGPCQCGGGVCGCCSRILYDTWKQKACVNVTYDPDEFSFTAKIMMNDRVLYTRSVSGKNPRPICVPVPRIPFVKACVRFHNIYFQGRNIHLCINMEGKFRETTLFKVGLDCVRFGSNGLALVKPEDGGGLGQVEFLPGDDDNDDDYEEDDYDDDDDDDDDYL